ncbi:hypothetical protein [Flavobacterium sp. N1994]|uniref:hypothetical protein n=1 Tax=Flavobacterium sp. N1994 TaxID=2986827 RepID=UPI0022221B88|nr:hypothetical protein [Flavobacterium sp. N1994]
MKRHLIIILISISILISLIFTGFPIEFSDMFTERIARFVISILVIIIFFFLFKLSKKINSKILRIAFIILIVLTALPYTLICIYNISTAFSNNYSRWKDISILEKKDGKKIAYQVLESGSIYNYRYRKIIYENKSIRISVNCDIGNQTGWSETKVN